MSAPKPEVLVCTVGMLLGDAWVTIPAVRDLCSLYTVKLVCGSYAQPAWDWAGENIVGCDWTRERVVLDPDDHRSAFCPGFGTKAMEPALTFVRGEYPQARVLGYNDIGNMYQYPESVRPTWSLTLKRPRDLNAHTAIHAYTAHDWKNCDMIVDRVEYHAAVEAVGLPAERAAHLPQRSHVSDFAAICESILTCRGFVGVLSSWTNFAAIFRKRQIVVAFTADVPLAFNPNARVLVKPSMEELQAEIERMGL